METTHSFGRATLYYLDLPLLRVKRPTLRETGDRQTFKSERHTDQFLRI